MKKVFLVICCLLLVACSNTKKIEKESTFLGYITDESNEMVLLLNTEMYITTVDSQYKEQLINIAKEETIKYHKLLDSHHYYLDDKGQRINNIKVLNDSINQGPITVDPVIVDALNEAITLTKLSHGYFNVTLGKLSQLYKDKFLPFDTNNNDPDSLEIEEKIKGIVKPEDLSKYIFIDSNNNTIELKSDDYPYELDLGAFSKGYIIDKVYKELIQYNTSFLLTAGSSSIVTYVASNEDVSWSVGVRNPEKIAENLLAFNMKSGAISTSGDYENYYFLENGTRRHHILNPFTGYSENYYHSNTLLSSNAGIIDALSTALFSIEDKDERIQIIKDIENYYNIKIEYCFVKDDNSIIMNNGFKDSLINASSLDKIKTVIED